MTARGRAAKVRVLEAGEAFEDAKMSDVARDTKGSRAFRDTSHDVALLRGVHHGGKTPPPGTNCHMPPTTPNASVLPSPLKSPKLPCEWT